jgi:cytochrome P450
LSIAQLRGRWHLFVQAAHEQYGPVVRVGPSELSYISATAWKDTCARREGNPPLPRDHIFFNEMLVDPRTMTMANNADHARLRRALNPAFSQKALLEQESILQRNVDVLLDQIGERARRGLTSDLRAWYNYATFDLIGDLAFGDTFGCLKNSQFHEWVQMVLDYFYAAILLQVVHRYRPLDQLLAMLLPSSVVQKKERHTQMALDKVRARTSSTGMSGRHDFIHYMQRAVEAGSITSEELEMQASIIILAGSETTSIALTYATYFLLSYPKTLDDLRAELAGHFTHEDEITLLSVNQLHFLQAVLQETLRLRPPITNGFPRQTPPGGAVIDGQYVPKNVSTPQNPVPVLPPLN